MAIFESGTEIDFLFSDVKMPGTMDGNGLARRVKVKWPATHVMLTSGYSNALLDPQDKPASRILPKPYRPLSVLAAILSAVEP